MADYAKISRDEEAGVATLTYGDDTQLVAELSALSQDIINRLALHGLGQKLVDSYASAKKAVESGEYESEIEYAKECSQEVWSNLTGGIWSAKRSGSGGPRSSQLAQAIAEVTGQDLQEVINKLATLDEEVKKAYAKKPKVQIALLRIRAAAEAAKLAKLEAVAEEAGDDSLDF